MDFKVGDRVKVVYSRASFKNYLLNKEFIITKLNPNGEYTGEDHYSIDECYVVFDDELELVEDKKVFTKKDLKTGMFGVMDDGDKFVIINDQIIYQTGEWDHFDDLDENLEMFCCKIDKVYASADGFDGMKELIYDRERDTVKEMTIGEIEKILGHKVKVVKE